MVTEPTNVLVVADTDNNKKNEEDRPNRLRQFLYPPLLNLLGNAPFFLCPRHRFPGPRAFADWRRV